MSSPGRPFKLFTNCKQKREQRTLRSGHFEFASSEHSILLFGKEFMPNLNLIRAHQNKMGRMPLGPLASGHESLTISELLLALSDGVDECE